MNRINFDILTTEEFDADHFGNGRYLTGLGGCQDGENYGLGDWQFDIQAEVTNKDGETRTFTVCFQPEERSNGMKAYSGYDLCAASLYGCDSDESNELVEFCEYDEAVMEAFYEIAKNAAKAEFERLEIMRENGEITTLER